MKILTGKYSFTVIIILISLISFRGFNFSTMKKNDLGRLITYLGDNHVRHVYCYDYMLTYQVIFYSREQLLCREPNFPNRYLPYAKLVDSAFNGGAKTALLYNELQLRNMCFGTATRFNGYIIVFDPLKKKLGQVF